MASILRSQKKQNFITAGACVGAKVFDVAFAQGNGVFGEAFVQKKIRLPMRCLASMAMGPSHVLSMGSFLSAQLPRFGLGSGPVE